MLSPHPASSLTPDPSQTLSLYPGQEALVLVTN